MDSSQLVLPCHLNISSAYALADIREARDISHLYLPVLRKEVSKSAQTVMDEGT